MRLRIKSSQDFWSGLAFIAFGAATAILSTSYPLGVASRMGPGYFPMLLGVLLAGIGVAVALRSVTSAAGGNIGRIDVWLMLRLLLSLVTFGVLLYPVGLLGAAFVTILVAAWAGPEFRILEGIVSAVVLSVMSWLVFVLGLKQTIPVLPSWLG
jgi:putative tricarboxylic transport membrane protein